MAVLVLGLGTATACGSGDSTSSTSTSSTATSSTASTSGDNTCATGTTVAGSNSGPEVNPPGDIPDDQAFVEYSPASGGWSVHVPEGWARSETADGATFTDKLNTVEIKVVDAPTAPTIDSATSVDVAKLEKSALCFTLGGVTTVTRHAGDAILITFTADSAPDPVTGKVVRDDVERYAFWKGGKEAILTLSGSSGSDNVDPWKIVTDSYAWR